MGVSVLGRGHVQAVRAGTDWSIFLYVGRQKCLYGGLVVDERRMNAFSAGLRYVFHDKTVDLNVFVEFDERSVRLGVFIAVNITDNGISDSTSEGESDDG